MEDDTIDKREVVKEGAKDVNKEGPTFIKI